jgi:hypothetical protein
VDRAVRGEEGVALSGQAQEEEALAGEERAGAAPGRVALDRGGAGEEGGALGEDGLAADRHVDHVARDPRRDGDLARGRGGEGVDEERLAAEHGTA